MYADPNTDNIFALNGFEKRVYACKPIQWDIYSGSPLLSLQPLNILNKKKTIIYLTPLIKGPGT